MSLPSALLLILASSGAGQYGGYHVPPYNMTRLGSTAPVAPGYGMPSPYGSQAPALSSDGTVPGGYFSPGYQAYYPPPGTYTPPAGAALQGLASMTSAQGNYWNQIEQARILRQQANQAALETRKKQIQFETWYEQNRPTALTMAAQNQSSLLTWARNDAEDTQIWDGRPLNVLLQSILRAPNRVLPASVQEVSLPPRRSA
jgi:hypothetical protein